MKYWAKHACLEVPGIDLFAEAFVDKKRKVDIFGETLLNDKPNDPEPDVDDPQVDTGTDEESSECTVWR